MMDVCKWKKVVDSIGGVHYLCSVIDTHGELVKQETIYKGYSPRYKRVMYSYLSSYRETLKEIKELTESTLLAHDCIMCSSPTTNTVQMATAFFTGDFKSKDMCTQYVCGKCMENLKKIHG